MEAAGVIWTTISAGSTRAVFRRWLWPQLFIVCD